ncbi:MAG: helix-turn-helix transcriptional regulator [Oscillospiraceae bacterium]|nr:helix-turn-helix transcriptional regulator [Oscillospiraceae bacterium]
MKYQRLEDLRIDKDLRQKDVADHLYMQVEVYRRYEKGERELPVWVLIKLAEFYNTSADYILGLTDRQEPAK